MAKIEYIAGDATQPKGNENRIIVHICNDIGGWGKGFVNAISKRWKAPEVNYRKWYASKENFKLGEVQFIQVEERLWVANMIGQHKIRKDEEGNAPIRYSAVALGLQKVAAKAMELDASIHMPRIGCGLAGGKWTEIEPIIKKTLLSNNVNTTVYDFQ